MRKIAAAAVKVSIFNMAAFDFSQSYYSLFALPLAYDVDASALSQRFRALQTELHPDRFAAASEAERRMSVQAASWVNQAYQTLKDDRLRARYLLELREVAFDDEKDTSSDPQFLIQQMEYREGIEEAQQAADPLAALDHLSAEIKQERAAIKSRFAQAYAESDNATAKDQVLKMRFFERLLGDIDRLQADLEDALF